MQKDLTWTMYSSEKKIIKNAVNKIYAVYAAGPDDKPADRPGIYNLQQQNRDLNMHYFSDDIFTESFIFFDHLFDFLCSIAINLNGRFDFLTNQLTHPFIAYDFFQ